MGNAVTVSITVVGMAVTCVAGYLVAARGGLPASRLGARLTDMRDGLDRSVTALGGFVVLAAAVMTLVSGLMYGVGLLVRRLQPLDWAVYHWVAAQQTPDFVALMELLTQVGNKQPCWVVAALTAVVYAVVAPRRRWAGLLVVGAVVVLQHYQQVALAELVHRGHPPGSGGTFPSGGAARTVAVYGSCALVLLRATGAGRRTVAVTCAVVAAVAFFEGWSRLVLNAHWVTDVLAGWLSGALLLAGLGFASWSLLVTRRNRTVVTR